MASPLTTLWILMLGCVTSLAASIPLPPEDDVTSPAKEENKVADVSYKERQTKTPKEARISIANNPPDTSSYTKALTPPEPTLAPDSIPVQNSTHQPLPSIENNINTENDVPDIRPIDNEIGEAKAGEEGSEEDAVDEEDDEERPLVADGQDEEGADDEEEDDEEESDKESSGNYYLRLYLEEQKRSRGPIRLPWE